MGSQYDNLVFRFDGKDVTPSSIGRELVSILGACFDLADSIGDGGIGIESISNNCISIKFMVTSAIIASLVSCDGAVCDILKYNQAAKSINSFISRHAATMQIIDEHSNVLTSYSSESPILERKLETITWRSRTNIYGELVDIGGNTPNVHIQMRSDEKSVVLGIDKENARKISGRLYSEIGVVADVVVIDGKIVSGTVVDILDYDPKPWDEWQKKMGKIIGDAFMNESVESFIERVRG